ncbi:DsbA family protein [Marinomonas piezotolerans]|uniref:DsbA family protein n=1 Tax=Marinomonas piezotolerans TaxID=2213058 RepID=A0A370UAM3_9GAMM|nr:DsbA family protein [Marinomonas piezotolerans]RDL44847.1 DsbA family protein [Marinomonas piezotolerans]
MTKIHYFFDPMCGWCYGASSLVNILSEQQDIEVLYHPGGMLPKQAIDPSFQQHILRADQHIAELTHVTFSDDYVKRIASNEDVILDSFVTTQAFYAGKQLGVEGATMLAAIQSAHYVDALPTYKPEVLAHIGATLGLEASAWQTAFAEAEALTHESIQATQQLMPSMQVRGYPTFIMETEKGLYRLPHTDYYGRPDAWKAYLATLM